jgi:pimeloyl-ACP methyl ester carboxylesterase
MTSTTFLTVNNQKPDTLVLIPGWATDHRIFKAVTLPYNFLIPVRFSPATFVTALADELRERGVKRISLFGYSLGGFLACDFVRRHGECVDRIMLAGIRRGYDAGEIAMIKKLLRKNKNAFLYKFYEQCCAGREQWLYFKNNYFEAYCREFDIAYLNEGLDYLAAAGIEAEYLRAVKKITILHGECDRVAPLAEANEIHAALPQSRLTVVPGKGHMFFLPPGNTGDDFG